MYQRFSCPHGQTAKLTQRSAQNFLRNHPTPVVVFLTDASDDRSLWAAVDRIVEVRDRNASFGRNFRIVLLSGDSREDAARTTHHFAARSVNVHTGSCKLIKMVCRDYDIDPVFGDSSTSSESAKTDWVGILFDQSMRLVCKFRDETSLSNMEFEIFPLVNDTKNPSPQMIKCAA